MKLLGLRAIEESFRLLPTGVVTEMLKAAGETGTL